MGPGGKLVNVAEEISCTDYTAEWAGYCPVHCELRPSSQGAGGAFHNRIDEKSSDCMGGVYVVVSDVRAPMRPWPSGKW